ncbi:hypothetical protein E3U23_12040 [Erythrobacter litoralis]|uniref:hypothetical protein n=1 Tax=Erythrobacter litoralis TaxID=39960 RepID=UPI0024351F0C|nr:hypothetical protein [Erythrobacter litoralis]MDG6079920.1 hypothetical protein [Erythrobacter litoralis]
MSRHQRTILIADFELPRGAVTVEQLMAMPRAGWEHLRNQINVRRREDRSRPIARCRICEGGVFIRAQAVGDSHIPMYAHYPEASKACPWYEGNNLRPDDARAAQYQGHQESALHRRLCSTIEQLVKADPSCTHTAVNTYLRSEIHKRGRWPDVFADLSGLGRFAFEVQLSKPFAPEIAARHVHYDAEGITLVWIFNTLECPMPQGFHDVVAMQRGNVFVFDDEAEAASIERETLALKCFMENGQGGWHEPRLIVLDDLQTGYGRSAFVEDCRSEALKQRCKKERSRWWDAAKLARQERPNSPEYSDHFEDVWSDMKAGIPGLWEWERDFWIERSNRARAHAAVLYAILCSVAHSAAANRPILHITRFSGDGAVLSMLNSKLNGSDFKHCASLIEAFVGGTSLSELLEKASLRRFIAEAKQAEAQVDQEHPLWRVMTFLFPEVLDGLVRAELTDLGQLPDWASSAPSGPIID